MTQPSNLKVKRLVELDELPVASADEAFLYAVQNNHDYKVSVAGIADAAVDAAAEEAANAVKDELAGSDGASLIGYGGTTVEAALDAIGDILDADPEPPDSLTIVNDSDGNLWFRNADNTVDRGLVYITGSGASQTMNIRVYDDSTGLHKTLSVGADGTITWDGYAVYHEGNIPPWDPGDPGDAVVADRLAIPRNINGTPFDGTTNITTATWGTARTLTIGNTGKSVNGSGNVTWTLSDIGAAPASHTHTIANITGLQSALDGKAASSHTHTIANVTGLQSALDGKAAASHTHSASQITSGKFSTDRIPHITGDETAGWARLSCNGDNANLMGSLRILTGGASLRYYYEGSSVWQLNSNGSMVLYGPLSANSGNLTFSNAVDMPTNAKISWGGQGAIRANTSGVVVSAESGTVYLRPSGDGTSSNQTTINSSGHMSVSGNISSGGTVSDSAGDLRRTNHRTAIGNGTFADNTLNCINEKNNNTAYTWTIPSGLGTPGDIITVLNTGSSGNVTVAAGSGVTMYRSGSSVSSVVVGPGHCINFLRTSVSNRWQVMG